MAPIETQLLPVDDPRAIDLAVALLARAEPIAFPTDTVYGVGAHALLPGAVMRLYEVKRRPRTLAIPLLLSDAGSIEMVCVDLPDVTWELARRFWPGPLSLILRRAPIVPDAVTAGGVTVAVRVPDHTAVREICRRLGAPLAATSANLHGRPDPATVAAALRSLGGRVPLVLDGGPSPGGVPSTLLDLTSTPALVRRQGPVTAAQLSEVLAVAS